MNNTRRHSMLISFAALLALLLQVQTVFACEMMERTGPVAECCCGHIEDGQEAPDCCCCTLQARLTLKADPQDDQAALPAAGFALELPQLAPPPNLWPPIPPPPFERRLTDAGADPAFPGSRTWLATQRLRI